MRLSLLLTRVPISEFRLGAALVYVRVQSPSTSCLHEATQRNTVSFSDLRKPSLSFGPAAAAGQSGGTSESGEARANPKSRIRGPVGGTRGLAHVPAPVMLALRSGGLAGPHNLMWASRNPGAATELLFSHHGHLPKIPKSNWPAIRKVCGQSTPSRFPQIQRSRPYAPESYAVSGVVMRTVQVPLWAGQHSDNPSGLFTRIQLATQYLDLLSTDPQIQLQKSAAMKPLDSFIHHCLHRTVRPKG